MGKGFVTEALQYQSMKFLYIAMCALVTSPYSCDVITIAVIVYIVPDSCCTLSYPYS